MSALNELHLFRRNDDAIVLRHAVAYGRDDGKARMPQHSRFLARTAPTNNVHRASLTLPLHRPSTPSFTTLYPRSSRSNAIRPLALREPGIQSEPLNHIPRRSRPRPSDNSVKRTASRSLVVSSALADEGARGSGKSERRRQEEGNETDEEDAEFDDEYVLDEDEDEEAVEEEEDDGEEEEEDEEEGEEDRTTQRLRFAADVAGSDIMTSGSARSAGRTGQVRDVPAEPLVMLFSVAGGDGGVGGRGSTLEGGSFVTETWRGLGSGRSGNTESLEANGVDRGGQVTTAASVGKALSGAGTSGGTAAGGYFDGIDAFDEQSLRRRIMEEASVHARRGDAAAVEERVQELQRLGLQPGPRLWHLLIVSHTANNDLFGAVGG